MTRQNTTNDPTRRLTATELYFEGARAGVDEQNIKPRGTCFLVREHELARWKRFPATQDGLRRWLRY